MAFFDFTGFDKAPLKVLLQHPYAALLVFVVVFAFTIISGLIARLGGKPSERAIREKYLQYMIGKTEKLSLTGIPAGLTAQSVPLDKVFINLEFFPKRMATDYPVMHEDYKRYHEQLRRGELSEEGQGAIFGIEKQWQEFLRQGDHVSIPEMWQELTSDLPSVVIQGYPGMGKSTLLSRLTLHVARCGCKIADPSMNICTSVNAPLPILVLLKEYAPALKKAQDQQLPVLAYLKQRMDEIDINIFPLLQTALERGRCVVMFDGLDEVSELEQRKLVKQTIEEFVLKFRSERTAREHFNRFIITSRVAGYDLVAFDDYFHFTVAELKPEQVTEFREICACRKHSATQRTRCSGPRLDRSLLHGQARPRRSYACYNTPILR